MNYALVVESIAILVSVAIAIWQYIALRVYRKIDRAHADAEAATKEERQRRLERQDSWQLVYVDIHQTLSRTEDVASEAKTRPLDSEAMARADLPQLQQKLENLSQHCPVALTTPLQCVAAAIGDLAKAPYPADVPPPEAMASSLGAMAITQYQAVLRLQAKVKDAWDAVQNERGSA